MSPWSHWPLALTGYEIGLLTSAVIFIAFALVVALVVPRSCPGFPSKYLGWFIGVCIVLFAVQLSAVILLAEVGEEEEVAHEAGPSEPTSTLPTEPTPTQPGSTTESTETETATTEPEPTEGRGDPAAGKKIFVSVAGCPSCHTLADAGATGTVGPNLDAASPSADKVVERVTNGFGVMPPFKDDLTEQQIQDVAAYVSSVAGG